MQESFKLPLNMILLKLKATIIILYCLKSNLTATQLSAGKSIELVGVLQLDKLISDFVQS